MKKIFLSTPAIIAAIVICLFTATAYAAPGIDITKWISDNGVDWVDDTSATTPLIVTEGDEVYYRIEITNTGLEEEDPNLMYTLDDSDFGPLATDQSIVPGDTDIYEMSVTASLTDEVDENTATVAASYEDGSVDLDDETAAAYYYAIISPETMQIDIKPGSYPNSINLRSRGVVPVALLCTSEDEADSILEVWASEDFYFAGVTAERVNKEDVDGDGIDDIICHFKTEELDLDENSTYGIEIGDYDDIVGDIVPSIVGNDGDNTVNIVPEGKANGHSKTNSSQTNSQSNNGKAKGKNK